MTAVAVMVHDDLDVHVGLAPSSVTDYDNVNVPLAFRTDVGPETRPARLPEASRLFAA